MSIDFLKFNNKQNLDHNTFFCYLDVHIYMEVLCKSRTSWISTIYMVLHLSNLPSEKAFILWFSSASCLVLSTYLLDLAELIHTFASRSILVFYEHFIKLKKMLEIGWCKFEIQFGNCFDQQDSKRFSLLKKVFKKSRGRPPIKFLSTLLVCIIRQLLED